MQETWRTSSKLVEVTGDLAVLARQVDPCALTRIYRKVDLLKKKVCTLKAALGGMLTMRAESVNSGSLILLAAVYDQ